MFWSMGSPDVMSMPGTGHSGSEQLPAVGVLLAFGLLGYAWWTGLRLTGLTRVALVAGGPGRVVAPRLAACCEVAMSLAMAVPLIGLA
jgi:hypothetical protein